MTVRHPDTALAFDVDDFSYKPTFVRARVGDTLRLTLHNDGSELHSFVIDGFGSSSRDITPGGTRSVVVSLERPGEFVFYCRFHRYIGMQGAIIVRR